MVYVCFVKSENVQKAEDALRADFDVAARQSITVRSASSLGIKREGSFFLISGSEEGVKKCQDLLKGFAEKVDEKGLKEAERKIREEQEKAVEGFGGIFG